MRVLLLDHSQYITGGLPKTIEVAESLAARGHNVTLMATSRTRRARLERLQRNGVRVIVAPSLLWGRYRNGADLWDAFRRTLAVRSADFDLVHAYDCRPTVILPALFLTFRRKLPLVLDWDDLFSAEGTIAERSGAFYHRTLGRLEAAADVYFRRFADAHIVVSRLLEEKLLAMGVAPTRILRNHYGSRFASRPVPSRSEARARINLPADRFVIGYAGNIFPADEQLLLRVIRGLPERVRDRAALLVVGTPLSEARSDWGMPLIRTERLPDEAFFLHLAAADVLILPCRTTPANRARWPSKFTDYCAAGRPVISTPVGDLPDLFERQPIGILTDDDSASRLARAVVDIHDHPERARRMGEEAKRFARREFDLASMAARIEAFYLQTLG